MEPLDWLLRAGSVGLALLAGWMFGRTTPQWQEDHYNEGSRLHYGASTPYYSRTGSAVQGCGIFAAMTGGGGRWVWGLLTISAFALAFMGWPLPEYGSAGRRQMLADALMQWTFWAPVVAFALGYIPARLSDRGPVGPLD